MKTALNDILSIVNCSCDESIMIKGISDDSRIVKKNWLYVSRLGHMRDGDDFIDEALAKGAYVLCRHHDTREHVYGGLKESMIPEILHVVYGDLCEKLTIIAVTGTSGKTSLSALLEQLITLEQHRVMRIGTDGVFYPEGDLPSGNTTPSIFYLAYLFAFALEKEITHIVMEVSSHAIDQNRIAFIRYDAIVYTNITSDHLDYHLTRTHYRYTKFKLRRYLKEHGIIYLNDDCEDIHALYRMHPGQIVTFGKEGAHVQVEEAQLCEYESRFTCMGYKFETSLIGEVNLYNALALIALGRGMGISYPRLQQHLKALKRIPGRMEVIYNGIYTIWIDYAHTADSLQQILKFAASFKEHRIITIIGCGGERDRSKRPLMMDLACTYSDIAIATADNPRGEALDQIFDDMLAHQHGNVLVFENRYYAIKHAIKIACKSDIIIIAGRGDEHEQAIRGKRIPFHDRDTAIAIQSREEH